MAMPHKAKGRGVVPRRGPEGKTPEHYQWKRVLEKEWAGEWKTLAKLTDYCVNGNRKMTPRGFHNRGNVP